MSQDSFNDTTTASAQPTAKDATFFYTILTSMNNKPDVDWALVARKAGYNNGNTARTRYGQIIRKITGGTPAASTANAAPPVVPHAQSPRQSGGKSEKANRSVGSGTNRSPSKITKSSPSKAKGKVPKEVKFERVDIFEDEYEEWTYDI